MKKLLLFAAIAISTATFAQVPNYVPTNGLVGWWPFCGNANDASGNSNNGSVTGATLSMDRFGNTNSAYSFNGSTDEIVITNNLLTLDSDYTVSCWMNSSDVSKIQQCLFNSINHTGFVVELNNENIPPNKLMYGVGPANAFWNLIYAQGSYNLYQNNTWYHVIFEKAGTTYTLYVNNISDGSSVVSASTNYNQSVGLRIGSIGGMEFFKGKLDDFGVWNRTLTAQERTDLYSAQFSGINAGIDQTVCEGDSVTLSGFGGSNYQWNNSVVDGTPFIPTATQNYIMTGEDGNGCLGADTILVTVNPLPAVNGGADQVVCEGETVNLSGSGGVSYSWNNGINDGTEFTPTASQTYTVTGTDANGCENTDDVLVTVNPLPDVSGVADQTINLSAGNTAQFTLPSGSTSYQWQTDLGVGFQNMSNAGQYSGTTTNVLTISNVTLSNFNQQFRCVVSEGNCSDTSDVATLTVIDDLSIEENGASTINIYPNPTATLLSIEGEGIQNKEFTLVDIQGSVVLNGTFKSNKETIDLKTLARGQYMLRVEGKELKVVKE